jgi:hypothetical protein
MSDVKPSQVADAVRRLFGNSANDLDTGRPNYTKQVEVRALLSLLDNVPRELLALPFDELLEFERCCAALTTILPSWNLGHTVALPSVAGKNPIERIRILLLKCPDELPRPEPELWFMTDDALRVETEAKLRAAWVNFKASEWLGATVFAGCALEAMLLWDVTHRGQVSETTANKKHLTDLIDIARKADLITALGADLAHAARDGRDLLHPGRAAREGTQCSKATSLTALVAVAQVAEELNRAFEARA